MPIHEETTTSSRELHEHREPMGDGHHLMRDHSNPHLDTSDHAAITSLMATLTDPRRYNRVRRLFSPFPVLTNQSHAYLSLLSIEAYLQDIERVSSREALTLSQLIDTMCTSHTQVRHYIHHASHQLLVGMSRIPGPTALEQAIRTQRL